MRRLRRCDRSSRRCRNRVRTHRPLVPSATPQTAALDCYWLLSLLLFPLLLLLLRCRQRRRVGVRRTHRTAHPPRAAARTACRSPLPQLLLRRRRHLAGRQQRCWGRRCCWRGGRGRRFDARQRWSSRRPATAAPPTPPPRRGPLRLPSPPAPSRCSGLRERGSWRPQKRKRACSVPGSPPRPPLPERRRYRHPRAAATPPARR